MTRSATDVMQDIIFAAVMDGIEALKTASKGLPNNLVRDLGALHVNTTFADLPPELRTAIAASVRAAFTRLQKEGYVVSGGKPAGGPDRPARPMPAHAPRGAGPKPRRPQSPNNRSRPGGGGGRPPGKPGPGRPGNK